MIYTSGGILFILLLLGGTAQFIDAQARDKIAVRKMITNVKCAHLVSETHNVSQGPTENGRNEVDYNLAQQLAQTAIDEDPHFLGRTRVIVKGSTMTVDISRVDPKLVLGEVDKESIAVEALIRSRALRRDVKKTIGPNVTVDANLDQVDHLASDLLASKITISPVETSKNIEHLFERIDGSLQHLAMQKAYIFVEIKDATEGFKINVVLDPTSGKLFMMPYLKYRKCIALHQSLEQAYDYIAPGRHTLIGRYHYLSKWSTGTEENNIWFTADGSTTFSPPGKS